MIAENYTFARPYAQAAYIFAKENNQIQKWIEMLHYASLIVENDLVKKHLKDPKNTSNDKIDFIISCHPNILNENHFINFLKHLSNFKRLQILKIIYKIFFKYHLEQENIIQVTIESAFDLTTTQEEELKNKLEKKFQGIVEIKTIINTELIGGVIIRTNKEVIDISVRGQLKKLKNQLQG